MSPPSTSCWRDGGDHVAAARLLLEAGSEVSEWSVANATPELAELFRKMGKLPE